MTVIRDNDKIERINLRMPTGIMKAIDDSRKQRPGRVSKNTWIIEAIEERLERERRRQREENHE